MFWFAIEITTKPIIQIQACKFFQNSETGNWNYITSFCFREWNPDWKAGPNLNSDVQVETDIQRGVMELYYDTLKAMDVDLDSDSDADSIWIWYDRRVSRNVALRASGNLGLSKTPAKHLKSLKLLRPTV